MHGKQLNKAFFIWKNKSIQFSTQPAIGLSSVCARSLVMTESNFTNVAIEGFWLKLLAYAEQSAAVLNLCAFHSLYIAELLK